MSTVPETEIEAKECLALGIREYHCNNIDNALDHLEKACKLVSSKFGELASENIDTYYHYGLALMTPNSSGEEDVLSSLLAGQNELTNDSEDSEQQKEDNDQPNESYLTENTENNDSKNEEQSLDDSKNEEQILDDSKNEEQILDDSKNEEKDFDDCINEKVTQEASLRVVNNLEIAWEIFELLIHILKDDKMLEGHVRLQRLSQVHMNLAQISLESGNFDEALNDISKSIEIRSNPESKSAVRGMAECHYLSGLVNVETRNFDSSINEFNKAIEVLLSTLGQSDDSDDEEISKLIQELRQKVDDCEEGKVDMTQNQISEILAEKPDFLFDKTATSESFNDISHLVVHKRVDSPAKRPCAESVNSPAKKLKLDDDVREQHA